MQIGWMQDIVVGVRLDEVRVTIAHMVGPSKLLETSIVAVHVRYTSPKLNRSSFFFPDIA